MNWMDKVLGYLSGAVLVVGFIGVVIVVWGGVSNMSAAETKCATDAKYLKVNYKWDNGCYLQWNDAGDYVPQEMVKFNIGGK